MKTCMLQNVKKRLIQPNSSNHITRISSTLNARNICNKNSLQVRVNYSCPTYELVHFSEQSTLSSINSRRSQATQCEISIGRAIVYRRSEVVITLTKINFVLPVACVTFQTIVCLMCVYIYKHTATEYLFILIFY